MTKLYDLTTNYLTLMQLLEDDNQDVDAIKEELSHIEMQFNEKAESIARLILNYESDVDATEKELGRLSARKKTLDNKIKWLKEYLLNEMIVAKLDKIPGKVLTLSLRKSPMSINIVDSDSVPQEFKKLVPESWVVDKKLVADHIKDSGEIPSGIEAIIDKKTLMIK